MRITALFIVVISLLLSCNSSKKTTKSDKDYVAISMQKTECRGLCPVYKLEIYNSGKVVFNGIKNVDSIGSFEKRISKDEIKKLKKQFESAHFYQFKEEYDGLITDIPSTYISYNRDGKNTKTVRARFNIPQNLLELISHVEKIIEKENWNKRTLKKDL